MEEWEREQGLRVSSINHAGRIAESRRAQRRPTAWTYVRLMCVGAGVAIGVFFDRVLLIVLAL
jgi:hypothetical protein